jgi:hypothetical protein
VNIADIKSLLKGDQHNNSSSSNNNNNNNNNNSTNGSLCPTSVLQVYAAKQLGSGHF